MFDRQKYMREYYQKNKPKLKQYSAQYKKGKEEITKVEKKQEVVPKVEKKQEVPKIEKKQEVIKAIKEIKFEKMRFFIFLKN